MSDGLFAQIETNFIITDTRMDGLSDGAFRVYITLWCFAVHTRRETLSFVKGSSSIAHACRKDARSIPAALAQLQQLCLIEVIDENTIKVCGVIDKHPRLKWKDGDVKNLKKSQKRDIDIELDKDIDIDKNKIVEPEKTGPTDHKIFVEFFCQEYQTRFNVKYDFNGGRDGKLVKGLLKSFGLELLKKMTAEFFLTTDPFIKEKIGFTIPGLKMRANQIAASLSKNKTFYDSLSAAGQQTLRNAAAWLAKTGGQDAGK